MVQRKGPFHIHADHFVPFLFCDLVRGLVYSCDPGVVNEDIDLSKPTRYSCEYILDFLFLGHVKVPELSRSTRILYCLHRLLPLFIEDICYRYVRAFFRQEHTSCITNSVCSPSDDGDPVFYSTHGYLL